MILVAIGLIMVYSASAPNDAKDRAKLQTTAVTAAAPQSFFDRIFKRTPKAATTPVPTPKTEVKLAADMPQMNARVSGRVSNTSVLDTLRQTIETGGMKDPLSKESFQAILNSSLHSQTSLYKQLIAFIFGLFAMFCAYKINIDRYGPKLINGLLILTFIMLILVFFSQERNRAHRWIFLGGITIQPSEFAKLIAILWLGRILTIPHEIKMTNGYSRWNKFKRWFHPATGKIIFVIGLLSALIFIEPDMGGTVALLGIVFVMLIAYGLPLIWVIGLSCLMIILMYWGIHLESYRLARFMAFLDMDNPEVQSAAGYQLKQSLIALGSGGVSGLGLGAGQQKYQFLSEVQNDFIYALIGEEFGLYGTVFVLLLYALFVTIGMLIAKNAQTLYARLVAVGISTMIGISSMIHILVVIGLVPTKGLTLPLISLGGSSLVINLVAVGILLGIAKDNEQKVPPRRNHLISDYFEDAEPVSLSKY